MTNERLVAIISSSAPSLVLFRGQLIQDLVRRGYRVIALAPDLDVTHRAALTGWGAQPVDYALERTGTNLRRDFTSMLELTRLLHRYKPEIVLSYFMKPVIYGTLAAFVARVPHRFAMIEGLGYAFTDTGVASWRKRALKSAMKRFLHLALKCAERVVFLNGDDQREFIDSGIVAGKRSVVLGGIGLDVAAFARADVPDVQSPTFLMIGRLILEKGVVDFVEAARRVRCACPGVRFVLVGGLDPKPGSLTEGDVRAWVAEGIIEWAGEVGDVRPFLREASAFVLPSYREGVPRSTQEAMAIGRAVITTDVPGCRVTVRNGVNGFLVPPRNPEALARAMMRFVHDRELAATMGAESRRMAEADFDVHVVNARLLGYMNLSNRLITGAGQPQRAIRSN